PNINEMPANSAWLPNALRSESALCRKDRASRIPPAIPASRRATATHAATDFASPPYRVPTAAAARTLKPCPIRINASRRKCPQAGSEAETSTIKGWVIKPSDSHDTTEADGHQRS